MHAMSSCIIVNYCCALITGSSAIITAPSETDFQQLNSDQTSRTVNSELIAASANPSEVNMLVMCVHMDMCVEGVMTMMVYF